MNLEQRVERLERQNSRLRWGLAGLVLMAAAAFIIGQAARDPVPDVIRAKAFHIVDKDGRALVKMEEARIGTNVAGSVTIFNNTEKQMVTLDGVIEPPTGSSSGAWRPRRRGGAFPCPSSRSSTARHDSWMMKPARP